MAKIGLKVFKKLTSVEKYLLKAKSRDELLRRITKEIVSLVDTDVASIFTIDYDDMMLIAETGYGIDEREIKKIRIPLSSSETAFESYKTKKPVAVFNENIEGKIPKPFVKKYNFRSSLILPLVGLKRKVLGFLFLDTVGRTKRFTREEKILCECFANLAAVSLEQIGLRERLEKKLSILSAYNEITTSALHPLNIKSFIKKILVKSINILKMDYGMIQIVEDGKLVIKSHIGIPENYLKKYNRVKIGQHISGKVAKTQKPIIIEDALSDPRATKEVVRILGYRSLIAIPLVAKDKTIGVGSILSKEKRVFEKEGIDFFSNIGKQLGVIFENAMLFKSIDISNKKIKALLEVNQSIVSILDLSLLYRKVLDELPSIITCYAASILLLDKEKNELMVVAASDYGPKRREREKVRIRMGKGITGSVAKTGKPVIIPDVRERKSYIGVIKEIRSEIATPLSIKGGIIGVLNVESNRVNAYTKQDLEILTAFANGLAIAIENARLYQESKERTAQLELTNRVIKEIGKTRDINVASQKICEIIQGNFYYDHTLLFLLDEEGENLVLKGYAGLPYRIKQFQQSIKEGLLGLCVGRCESILENNTAKNKSFISQLPKEETALSEMDIPLIFGGKVFGVLSLQSRIRNAFSKWDLMTMESVSEHIASALNNADLFSHLRKRLSELSTIYEIGLDLSISRNLDELLEKIYKRASLMTGAKTFYVALYDEKNSTIKFEIDYEEGRKRPQEIYELKDISGYTGWILKNNIPILIKNFEDDTRKCPVEPIIDGLKMHSYLGIPIRFEDKVIGVLSLQSPESNLFDKSTLSLFTTFANQLGVVIENARLFTGMGVVVKKLERSYDQTLRSLVSALDFRERETQYHSVRVAAYAVELAKRLGISEKKLKYVYWGGILHDIGKIAIPDSILLKHAALTDDEWNEIKKHPRIGYEIVKVIDFLGEASEIVRYHHEWWDGKGYPYRKKKEQIPIYARIFSVVDTLDAITSKRPYRKARSFKEAYDEINRFSGRQFDPKIVNVFATVPIKFWERIRNTKPIKSNLSISSIDTLRK